MPAQEFNISNLVTPKVINKAIDKAKDILNVQTPLPLDVNPSELQSIVPPTLPPYPQSSPVNVEIAGPYKDIVFEQAAPGDKIERTHFGTAQVVPLSIKLPTETTWWLLPFEPMISIDGKNVIIKRNVAKKKTGFGSIKEYWTQDDFDINISGLLTDVATEYAYPEDLVKELARYCKANQPIEVKCPLLNMLGITRMVIESYSLPFTKGPENQNYTIKAVSDSDWSLIYKKQPDVPAT